MRGFWSHSWISTLSDFQSSVSKVLVFDIHTVGENYFSVKSFQRLKKFDVSHMRSFLFSIFLVPTMETEKVDVMVFGATGYTGKCVVNELTKFNETQPLSWAIAGRNEQKLREVLDWASSKTGMLIKWNPKRFTKLLIDFGFRSRCNNDTHHYRWLRWWKKLKRYG